MPQREPLRCPNCNRFLAEVAAHPENDLRISCQKCKSDVFLRGYTITSRRRPHRSRLLGDEPVDMDVNLGHVGS